MKGLYLAPMVIAHRLPRLWYEALHPNPLVSDESRLIFTEKMAALGEGVVAAQVESAKAAMAIGLALLTGKSVAGEAVKQQRRIVKAALRPAAKRVGANHRRLTRKD